MNFHDFQNIHFYPTALLHSFTLEGDSSFLAPEMMAKSIAKGCRFLEVPIPFMRRTAGQANDSTTAQAVRIHHLVEGRRSDILPSGGASGPGKFR